MPKTVIPGNFVDESTGEQLRPVYKWQDAMGAWYEKELGECSWQELHNYGIDIWNVLMSLHISGTQSEAHCVVNTQEKVGTFWAILAYISFSYTAVSVLVFLVFFLIYLFK